MRTRPGTLLAIACLVAAATACGSGAGAAAPAPEPASLARTDWRLVEYTLNGKPPVKATGRSTLHFDGKGKFAAHNCNGVGGDAVLSPTHVDFPPGPRISTQVACGGGLGDVDAAFGTVTRDRVGWTREGPRLRLSAEGRGTLVYEELDADELSPGQHLVVSGERNGWRYRVVATLGGGQVQSLSTETREGPGTVWSGGTHGAPSGGEGALYMLGFAEVGGDHHVDGFVPKGAVRVTHAARPGAPRVELAIHSLPGSPWRVFAGFVPSHSGSSVVTAYAADGSVVESTAKR